MTEQGGGSKEQFSEAEKKAVYRAIYERRDVRSQFLPDPVPEDVLLRILDAAHHAPSVGFSQPWDFIVIKNPDIKQSVYQNFLLTNEDGATRQGEKEPLYRSLKLEGILDAPINLCITCDRSRAGPNGLGATSIVEMDLFSTCLAVQNLWLAARAEGVGVGWVSILDNEKLSKTLSLPERVYPLAYLCVGYVSEFLDKPELESKGWRQRTPLENLIHIDRW